MSDDEEYKRFYRANDELDNYSDMATARDEYTLDEICVAIEAEKAVSVLSKLEFGDFGDVPGLGTLSIQRSFFTVSGIAIDAQAAERMLRRLKRYSRINRTDGPRLLKKAIELGLEILYHRRTRWRTTYSPDGGNHERDFDEAALFSLEGQLYLYQGRYLAALSRFEQSRKLLERLCLSPEADDGEAVLSVRVALNAFKAAYEADDVAPVVGSLVRKLLPVLTQEHFVERIIDVTRRVHDPRLAYNAAEAAGMAGRDRHAARLLAAAIETDPTAAADVSILDWKPEWLLEPVTDVPYLSEAIKLLTKE